MLGDLSPDLIGTDPKYIPIVNQDWLAPDIKSYDNYPSDNEPDRIQPKLGDMWNNKVQTGISLVPNSQSMPCRNAEWNEDEAKASVLREAKKAMMAGLSGTGLAEHLRARFAAEDIVVAKDELTKLSEEQGLLGNVYIDASAFTSATEADQFLTQHRNRLARDIVVNKGAIDGPTASYLANKYHKNVVASINYNENLFARYKIHLVEANKIDNSYEVDSKEALRAAFMAQPAEKESSFVAVKKRQFTEAEVNAALSQDVEKEIAESKLAQEELNLNQSLPIISFVREQLSYGKDATALKEMLRGKYATEDLQGAAKYLQLVASDVFTLENMERLADENKITLRMAKTLKDLIKKYPVRTASFEEEDAKPLKSVVKANLYAMPAEKKAVDSELCLKAIEMLRKGTDMSAVKDELLKEATNAEADATLIQAVKEFNATPAGVVANVPVVAPKVKVVADLPEPVTLPGEDTVLAQNQELMDFYKGADTNLEIDPTGTNSDMDFEITGGSEGLDSIL